MTTGTVDRVPEDVTWSQELAMRTDLTVVLALSLQQHHIIRLDRIEHGARTTLDWGMDGG